MTMSSPRVAVGRCLATGILLVLGLASCQKTVAEPDPPAQTSAATKDAPKTDTSASAGGMSTPAAVTAAATGTVDDTMTPPSDGKGDPNKGSFTLAEATKDLKGAGPIVAKLDTSKGVLQCKLLDDKAPITVANFIGLATGKRAWKDPSNNWVKKPAYDGTTFHRIIKGFMIQGGDARGNGTGEPGYVIKDELWGGHHDKAGLLCMANRGPNTNGAQFFITDAAAAHLDRSYTIFGECAPEQTIHDIANVPVAGERPVTPVTIKSVTISRDDKKK
jgi:peptidyl-prolyl cis-trans isomerase A (cyclophilin A)